MSHFAGRTVWITGASSGLGRAMAKELAKNNARLILSGRDMKRLHEVEAECSMAQEVHLISLDLEEREGIERIFEDHISLLEEVDILINNAGLSQRSLVRDTNFEVYRRLIDVNYLGTVLLSLNMLKIFRKKRSGHFVIISSMAGKFGVPLRSGYSAAKMALDGFFETLRAETDIEDLSITTIYPAFIRTNVSVNALTAEGGAQGTMDDAQEKGMSPEQFAKKALRAISKKEAEVMIGGFKATTLADLVNRFFPGLFRKMIRRSKVT
ncbi:MAG: SDR family oxidoreductase [Saprospiraceae bacterium]|nr:SDR family oxidoreductase [Saprospiraceae bacterium]